MHSEKGIAKQGIKMRGHIYKFLAAGALVSMLAGCGTLEGAATAEAEDASGDISGSSSFGSAPEKVWLEKAKASYRNGNYGLAERYYRQMGYVEDADLMLRAIADAEGGGDEG